MSDLSDRHTAAVEATYLALYRHWCERCPGSYLREDDASYIAITAMQQVALGNAVLRTRWERPLAPETFRERIMATLEPFIARRVPLIWNVWPSSRPADLSRYLEAAGPARVANLPAMSLDVAAWSDNVPHPPALRIETVSDAIMFERWIDVLFRGSGFSEQAQADQRLFALAHGYDMPVRDYLGWLDAMPVATTTLFVADGIAGIFGVATLPSARRRGVGAALTAAALRDACALGCHTAILISSPMGESVYRRLGFTEHSRVEQYVWMPASMTP